MILAELKRTLVGNELRKHNTSQYLQSSRFQWNLFGAGAWRHSFLCHYFENRFASGRWFCIIIREARCRLRIILWLKLFFWSTLNNHCYCTPICFNCQKMQEDRRQPRLTKYIKFWTWKPFLYLWKSLFDKVQEKLMYKMI